MTSTKRLEPDPERLAAARQALAAATAAAGASAADVAAKARPDVDDGLAVGANVETRSESRTVGNNGTARARQLVLRQLAMGPRTRQQLADKLRERDCDQADIEVVLDRMTEVGLVDDQAYAHMLVRTKREGSGLAADGLRHELRKRGVSPETTEAALKVVEPDQERARAESVVAARLPRLHGLERDVQMRRLGGLLTRKGYPADLALSVIREALDRAQEHARD